VADVKAKSPPFGGLGEVLLPTKGKGSDSGVDYTMESRLLTSQSSPRA